MNSQKQQNKYERGRKMEKEKVVREPVFYYYYLRDKVPEDFEPPKLMKKETSLGFPRVSVCLGIRYKSGEGPWEIVRGMAICSLSESFKKISRSNGRTKARGMVDMAFANRKSAEYIRRFDVVDNLNNLNREDLLAMISPILSSDFFDCRSCYNPTLTNFEKKIIGMKKED